MTLYAAQCAIGVAACVVLVAWLVYTATDGRWWRKR